MSVTLNEAIELVKEFDEARTALRNFSAGRSLREFKTVRADLLVSMEALITAMVGRSLDKAERSHAKEVLGFCPD